MKLEIVITMDEKGAVSVSGPIENMIFSLGMIEVAKKAIFDHAMQNQKKILKATAGDMAALGAL